MPTYLIDMCEAPTPYLIGLMRTCKNDLLAKFRDTNDMIIVDLDKQKCILDNDNDTFSLPDSILKSLKLDIYNLLHIAKSTPEFQKNIELCRIFLKIFLKTIGSYKNYIFPVETSENNNEELKFLVGLIFY